ncbi:MAG: DUF2520 domain-containing protein [Victivallales bacterium]|nr:DUF2520 domain-containing protein [Victivallales bacterium]
MSSKIQYLLIGNGRLAKHLVKYLDDMNISFIRWFRGCKAYLCEAAAGKDNIILLAVSDSAIEPFIKKNRNILRNKTIVHFSGALYTPLAYGCHPLMTFSDKLYEKEFYQRILFTLDEDAPDFNELFPELDNPNIKISSDSKAKYHSLCVMANNFTSLLWRKFFVEMNESFNADSSWLIPFLERTAQNITEDYKGCLTGPLARGDYETVEMNIKSLSGDPWQNVYKSFVEIYHKKEE